jgi:hypothetical protein
LYLLAAHASVLDVDIDRLEDGGRQRQIEEPVGSGALFVFLHLLVEDFKVAPHVVRAGDVVVNLPEFLVALGLLGLHLHPRVALGLQLGDGQLGARVAKENCVARQQVVPEQPPQGGVDLLFGQISLKLQKKKKIKSE